MKELYKRYAELYATMKEVEAEMEDVKNHITGFMLEKNVGQVKTEFGKFALRERVVYEFSPAIDKLKADVKKAEAEEKATGKAKSNTSRFLAFTR